MTTRRDVLKSVTIGSTGVLFGMLPQDALCNGTPYVLSHVTLESVHALAKQLTTGDRVVVQVDSIQNKIILKTYGFQFCRSTSDGDEYQFYPERNKNIEAISSIIYEDSKVTTYKIALLRALVDISSGLYSEHISYDTEDGADYVYIPYALVCYHWIMYYWPLLENQIPQVGRNTRLEFETALMAVMEEAKTKYALSELSQYLSQFKEGFAEGSPLQRLTLELMTKLRNAIRSGPVQFAGSEGTFSSSTRFCNTSNRQPVSLFDYIGSRGCIRLKLGLFFEMQVFGNILSDAIAVKWAQECVRFSMRRETQQSLPQILPHILADQFIERDQTVARELADKLLTEQHFLLCTYSGQSLRQRFDMDHILPYSIFYNNDLWNLVPAAPTVNNRKSSHIISLDTLNSSKQRLSKYWEYLLFAKQTQFSAELRSTLHINTASRKWESHLFDAIARQADTTAQHRGLKRWSL